MKETTPEPDASSLYTFGPKVFSGDEEVTMEKYCYQSYSYPVQVREPTEFEWKIMVGMVEGAIMAHKLPQFLKRVCDGENLLKFQQTILAQVEGELVGKLNDSTPMYADHQSSDRLVEAALVAARFRDIDMDKVMQVLMELKSAE